MELVRGAPITDEEGRLREAETLYREALVLHRKVHGSEQPDVSSTLNNLANVLVRQGRPAEAEPLYRETLAMLRRRR
jgi:hypothetical protein